MLRHGVMAGIIVVVATVGGLLIERTHSPQFVADAEIVYTPAGDAGLVERLLTTQRVLLESRRILQPVATEMALPLTKLEKAVEAEVVSGSQVLRLTVTASDAATAERITRRVTEQFMALSRADAQRGLEENTALVNTRIGELEARIGELQAQRDATADTTLDAQIQVLYQRIGSLQDQLTAIDLEQNTAADIAIGAPAQARDTPIRPSTTRGLASGATIGLVIAAAMLAVLRLRSYVYG